MNIASPILRQYPQLSEAQRTIVGHIDGPLLVIAGPGSGKTYSIVLRGLNLLLLRRAQPKQLVLCTFTEKAAFEMRDRLSAAARAVGYDGDLSQLGVPVTMQRIAINEEQIAQYDLPTKPRKSTERRRLDIEHTVEAEAMPAGLLRRLLRDKIESFLPTGALAAAKVAEESEREWLLEYSEWRHFDPDEERA